MPGNTNKVHYWDKTRKAMTRPACGQNNTYKVRFTATVSDVTCGKCLRFMGSWTAKTFLGRG